MMTTMYTLEPTITPPIHSTQSLAPCPPPPARPATPFDDTMMMSTDNNKPYFPNLSSLPTVHRPRWSSSSSMITALASAPASSSITSTSMTTTTTTASAAVAVPEVTPEKQQQRNQRNIHQSKLRSPTIQPRPVCIAMNDDDVTDMMMMAEENEREDNNKLSMMNQQQGREGGKQTKRRRRSSLLDELPSYPFNNRPSSSGSSDCMKRSSFSRAA